MTAVFEIRVTAGSLYRFLMYHAYHAPSGALSIAAGAGLIVFYLANRGGGVQNVWIYLMFGVLFLAYQPFTLYMSALRQARLAPAFRKPLQYTLSEEGLSVRQDGEEGHVDWESVLKVRENAKEFLVYTGKKNACIWIKRQMGDAEPIVRKLFEEHVPEKQRKLKGAAASARG